MIDDPIFDPWPLESSDTNSGIQATPRWRSPAKRPAAVRAPASPVGQPARRVRSATPQTRLPGTQGLLRTLAVPRLESVAHRVRLARHSATLVDRLAEPAAAVHLSVRPRTGPFKDAARGPAGSFSLSVHVEEEDEQIVATYRVEPDAERQAHTESISSVKFDSGWLEARIVDFLRLTLGQP